MRLTQSRATKTGCPMSTDPAKIRDKALEIVANAMEDEDLPAAKRADMALALLGKAAVKDAQEQADETPKSIEIVFRIVDDEGKDLEKVSYTTQEVESTSENP